MAERYLRRFKKSQYVNDAFTPEAFECDTKDGEKELSCHIRKPPLDTDQGVRDYQRAFPRPSGDLFGICEVSEISFKGIPLPTLKLPQDPAEPYAERHCEISPCLDNDQAARLAQGATRLLDYVKAKRLR